MKDLRFRAWDKASNTMIYFNGPSYDDEYDHLCFSVDYERHSLEDTKTFGKGMNDPMQYVGLKDRDDRRIYEGDVIQLASGQIGVVEWEKSVTIVKWIGGPISKVVGRVSLYSLWNPWGLQILGNIHENPILLEKREKA